MRSIQEQIEQYPDEWLAIDVKAEKGGRPKAGELVHHGIDRDEVWRRIARLSWRPFPTGRFKRIET